MGRPVDVHLLCRSWIRSRSEDTATEETYRPVEFAAPRRERGRSGYQFREDGTVSRMGPGATDVPRVAVGTWEIDERSPDRVRVVVDGHATELEVTDLGPDRLAIRRTSPADPP